MNKLLLIFLNLALTLNACVTSELTKENTDFINKIINEIQPGRNVNLKKTSQKGPYFFENRLFVNEDILKQMSNQEKRFAIGHELIHLKKFHDQDICLLVFLASWALTLTLTVMEPHRKDRQTDQTRLFASLNLLSMFNGFLRKRNTEFEADSESIKLLGEDAKLGAISYFNKEIAQQTLLNKVLNLPILKLFSTHPTYQERLKAVTTGKRDRFIVMKILLKCDEKVANFFDSIIESIKLGASLFKISHI